MANDKTPPKPTAHPLHDLALALFNAPPIEAKDERRDEGPLKLTERGAALFLAYIGAERGVDVVAKMTAAQAVEAAVLWRRQHVQCWQAMKLGDHMRMAMFSRALGKARGPRALQAEIDAILAPPRVVAPPKTAAA